MECLLAEQCKKVGGPDCNKICFPFNRLHGENGTGGVQVAAGVPKSYRRSVLSNLPFEADNPEAYRLINLYCKDIVQRVDDGVGLYLYGIPDESNPKGCGNGKTTAATAILNEYLIKRVILETKKEREINDLPGLFVNVSKFQNKFNAQFRGNNQMKEEATTKYYQLKELMTKVPLLIMDDIGVRDATEAFRNEFHEIIDDRDTNELPTIFTSNVPIEKLAEILDERIASRIEGATYPIPFEGEDKRKRGLE